METEKGRRSGNSIARAAFVALSLLLQIGWLLLQILELNQYSTYISLLTNLIAALAVLRLYSRRINGAYKMPWIMVIMALPVMGLSLYLLTEVSLSPRSARRRMERIQTKIREHTPQQPEILEELEQRDLSAANQCRYLWDQVGSAVYALTRSYYSGLSGQGVRIFEYSPGFCHGKQCITDGEIACIGTSNLDFRSLYLHFENNVLLLHSPAVRDMERDFLDLFPRCREVTVKYRSGRRAMLRIWQCILRLFAPMM